MQYPLPQPLPDPSTLPASAYGHLHIAQARIGNLQMADIHTALALRSDSIIFQDHISIALLGGHVILRQLEAYRLLQAQRHIRLHLRLQGLDLQQVQRGAANLPLAGRVDADFPRVQVRGSRLETEGALHLSIAGGRVRLHGVQVMRVSEQGSMLGDSYREIASTSSERQDVRGAIADGNAIIKVQVSLARGVVDAPRGSYYVPLNQPLANLVIAALEPDTQSSFFANQILQGLQSTVRVMADPTIKLEELN